jgi:hypothetical protein
VHYCYGSESFLRACNGRNTTIPMPGEQMNPPGSQHRTLKNSGMNYSQQGVALDPSKV